MEERALVEAACAGDADAFVALMRQYQTSLIATARYLTRHEDDAEDLVQEALLTAYRKLDTLSDPAKFRPWLFTILRHRCLTFLRLAPADASSLDDYADTLAAPVVDDHHDLLALLESLPLADREVLAARYLQELSYAEIADALGITVNAARVRCLRARERLRLKAEEDETAVRHAVGALLVVPMSETFADRVSKEVLLMATTTTKTAAIGGGLAALLAGWKIATLVLVGVLALGSGSFAILVHHTKARAQQVMASREANKRMMEESSVQLTVQHMPLDQVFEKLTEQTGVKFVMNSKRNPTVSVDITEDAPLMEVAQYLAKSQGMTVHIIDYNNAELTIEERNDDGIQDYPMSQSIGKTPAGGQSFLCGFRHQSSPLKSVEIGVFNHESVNDHLPQVSRLSIDTPPDLAVCTITWDGYDGNDNVVPAGQYVFVARMQGGDEELAKAVVGGPVFEWAGE